MGGVSIPEKRLGSFSVGKNEFHETYSNHSPNDFDKIEREYLELINSQIEKTRDNPRRASV